MNSLSLGSWGGGSSDIAFTWNVISDGVIPACMRRGNIPPSLEVAV